MITKSHRRIILLISISLLSLGAFSQQQDNSKPEVKHTRGKWYLKLNGTLHPFTPSAEGVDVTIGRVTYFVEGTSSPFEISTFAEPHTSNDHNTNPPHLNTPNKPAAIIPPTHSNPQQSSNPPATPSGLQNPSQPSNYTIFTAPQDNNKNLSSACQARLQDIYRVKIARYIDDLSIKERTNSNIPI